MMYTPWGRADSQTEVAPGIWHVTTPRHGGLFVERALRDRLQIQETQYSKGGFYEEDCDWAFVAIAFPEHFSDSMEAARNTLKNAYGGKYAYLAQ